MILVPLAYYARSSTREVTQANEAKVALEKIKTASDVVYVMGFPAKKTITIYVPSGVDKENTYVGNETLNYRLETESGKRDVFVTLDTCAKGTIPIYEGFFLITVRALEDGCIAIQEERLILRPIDMLVSVVYENTTTSYLNITNIWFRPLIVNLTAYGDAATYLDVDTSQGGRQTFLDVGVIGLDETKSIPIDFFGDVIGTHTGNFTVRSNVSEDKIADITFITRDDIPPTVTDTSTNVTDVYLNEFACISAKVTDNIAVDDVWATLTDASGDILNFTMNDVGPACAGTVNDTQYGVTVQFNEGGIWYLNTTYATDGYGNLGWETPFPDILIRVKYESGEGPITVYPDEVFHFQTRTECNITCSDLMMMSWADITFDMIDSDIQTPPAAYKIAVDAQDRYEGYVPEYNHDSSEFIKVMLFFNIRSLSQDNYTLVVYPYQNDSENINLDDYTIYNIQIGNETLPEWVEFDISDTAFSMDGFGFMKFRVTANKSMQGKTTLWSELRFKVA
jgi:hypothetical protein